MFEKSEIGDKAALANFSCGKTIIHTVIFRKSTVLVSEVLSCGLLKILMQ